MFYTDWIITINGNWNVLVKILDRKVWGAKLEGGQPLFMTCKDVFNWSFVLWKFFEPLLSSSASLFISVCLGSITFCLMARRWIEFVPSITSAKVSCLNIVERLFNLATSVYILLFLRNERKTGGWGKTGEWQRQINWQKNLFIYTIWISGFYCLCCFNFLKMSSISVALIIGFSSMFSATASKKLKNSFFFFFIL